MTATHCRRLTVRLVQAAGAFAFAWAAGGCTTLGTEDPRAVAERAQNIHDSFILEQSLSEQDLKDLEAAVPPAFLELDQTFHATAAGLAAAARAEDPARAAALFGRMVEDCAACHGRFAADRFPGLRPR